MPTLRASEVIRALRHLGFEVTGQEGSHISLRHNDGRGTVVPFHGARDLGRGIVRNIIRDAKVSRREFLDALSNS